MIKFNEAKSKQSPERAAKKAELLSKKAELKSKLEKIEKEIEEITQEFEIVKELSFDWKEISEELCVDIADIVKELGGYMYDNTSYEGSDAYGFFITKKPMTKSQVRHFSSLGDKAIDIEDEISLLK